MKTFLMSYVVGKELKSLIFDTTSTEKAIVIAQAWIMDHGSFAYTLVETGDYRKLAA